MITISHWLKTAGLKLNKISSSPYLDAEIILAFALKTAKEKLILIDKQQLSSQQEKRANSLLKKRQKGVPIAYIINEKFFYGLSFFVNENVLIPRPDSETIVEVGLKLLENIKNPTVLEIGVGSGALIISLVKNFKRKLQAIAFDISKKALNVAQKNIKSFGLNNKIKLKQNDLLTSWPIKNKIDLIIANLPYLPKDYLKNHKQLTEISLKFEPKISLFSGQDGLFLYRKLQRQLLKINFRYLIIEILPQQINTAINIFKNKKYDIKIINDFGGTGRFLLIENKKI